MLIRSSLPAKFSIRLASDFFLWILLPHIPTLFMTSPTHTPGHKMAALTVVFSRLSNADFNKLNNRSSKKYIVCMLYATGLCCCT